MENLEERTVLSGGWLANSFANAESSTRGRDIAVDAAGNVYVTGSFSGPMNLTPPSGGSPISLTGTGGSDDGFVAKLNSQGQLLLGRQISGAGADYASAIAVSAEGEVYVSGTFEDAANFTPTLAESIALTSSGPADIFVAKLDTNGNFLWALRTGGSATPDAYYHEESVGGIVLGADGAIYVSGSVLVGSGCDTDFDGLPVVTGQGALDAFVAKLIEDENGPSFQWVQTEERQATTTATEW